MATRINQQVLVDRVEVDGRRVIDVGSGAGGLVRFLCARGADAVGVECGEVMRQRALDADPDHPERYIDGVGQALPFADDSADVVVFFHSLHHIPQPDLAAALAEAARVTRADGVVYVLEPVAEGPGFETVRLVDDETVVRAHAQDALDACTALEEVEVLRYDSEYGYASLTEWEADIVGIDPTRAAALDPVRDEIARRFETNGERRSDGITWFPQPELLRIFRPA